MSIRLIKKEGFVNIRVSKLLDFNSLKTKKYKLRHHILNKVFNA